MTPVSPARGLRELAPGLHHWTARHPRWHPGPFGREVGSYALTTDSELLLIDPLAPDPGGGVPGGLDALAAGRAVRVLITIGYHTRSAEALANRYDATIHGPASAASRLRDPRRLDVLDPGRPGPVGVVAHAVGRPVRTERPLWLPTHAAVVFGDSIVTTPDGDLRLWAQQRLDERRVRRYREVVAPTFEPLLDHPVEHALTTHGPPVVGGGAAALRDALTAAPWYHRG